MNEAAMNPSEMAPSGELERLEKQYRRSQQKLRFILNIPILWGLGALLVYFLNISWLWEVYAVYCVAVIFVLGGYVLFRFPDADEIRRRYAQLILPGLLQKLGVENPQVA